MYVKTVAPEDAAGEVRAMYEADLAADGYIHTYTLLYSLNPPAFAAWRALIGSIRQTMDLRRYELVTLAAAMALRSRPCVSAHGAVLESKFYDRDQLERIARDYRTAELEPLEVALMAYAEKVALRAHEVTAEDVDALRQHGLSGEEIFNVALAAAARAFFSKSLDALGVEPDEAYASTSGLLDLIEVPVGASD